jgi:formamidopyrimidine-DNA glycosylase
MPELPEVETNARNLARWARGRRIVAATAPPGTRELGMLSRRTFVSRLVGQTVEEVTRRGKWILARLARDGAALGLHLGMTGKIAHIARGEPLPRFTRASFILDDGTTVCFVDSRRFGRLIAATWDDLVARPDIAAIGPDALAELGLDELEAALAGTSRAVKEAIMDQRKIAGVGNLYATEALWRARIHPATPARKVAADRALTKRLLTGIRAALKQGLETSSSEEPPEYIEEGAPNPFHAYDRAGKPCHRCKTLLATQVIGGRSSAFCPHCQPAPRRSKRAKSMVEKAETRR